MAKGQLDLARGEGVFACPEGGPRSPAARKLVASGFIAPSRQARPVQHGDRPQVPEDPGPARRVSVPAHAARRAPHLAAGAADLHDLDLRGMRAAGELDAALAARGPPFRPERGFAAGGGTGRRSARTRAPTHPVFLARRDGHAAWVNASGSRGARSWRRRGGSSSEAAFDAARSAAPGAVDRRAAGRAGPRLAELRALGIAAVDDMVEAWAPEVYARAPRSRRASRGDRHVAARRHRGVRGGAAAARVSRRATRGWRCAGSRSSSTARSEPRTAALSRPYADDPGTPGALRIAEREIPERVARWAARGWPVRPPRDRGSRGDAGLGRARARRAPSLRAAPHRARAGRAPLRPAALCARPGSSPRCSPATGATTDRGSPRVWATARGRRASAGVLRAVGGHAGLRQRLAGVRLGSRRRFSPAATDPERGERGACRGGAHPPGTLPARDDRPNLRRRDQVPRLPRPDQARAPGGRPPLGGRHARDGSREVRADRTA